MKKKQGIRIAVAAAFFAASAASGVALAADEVEQNYPTASAQRLTVGSDRSAAVNGIVGRLTGSTVGDVDYYSFYAAEGDSLELDIDNTRNPSGNVVDTVLHLYGPNNAFIIDNDDMSTSMPVDEGSATRRDSFISHKATKSGIYTVGVTGYPRKLSRTALGEPAIIDKPSPPLSNGPYTLNIRGVTPLVQRINIDIKPGSGDTAPMNPKSKGNVPVALLGASDFDAMSVNPNTLTFGATGEERSWLRCGKEGTDVNGDGKLDLVCHFENQAMNFDPSDESGILRGKTKHGTAFEGVGRLKVVAQKRADD